MDSPIRQKSASLRTARRSWPSRAASKPSVTAGSLSVKFLDEAGRLSETELDVVGWGVSESLPYAPEKYFLECPDRICVRMEDLVLTRARSVGVSNASIKMREAYDGTLPRREPISVSLHPAGFYVVNDGNSTVVNAMFSRWPDIPCMLLIPDSM